jgi:hypothetical protein
VNFAKFKQKSLNIILRVSLLSLLVCCSSKKDLRMIGTWESRQVISQGEVSRKFIYAPNGSFKESSLIVIGKNTYPYEIEGTWEVNDGVCTIKITFSKTPEIRKAGETITSKIRFIDDETMEILYPTGNAFKAYKIRETLNKD